MQYRVLKDGYLLKVERGEELIETLTQFCKDKQIHSGQVNGIGALGDVCLYYFDSVKKEYIPKVFDEMSYELLSLMGNIALIDGEPFAHVHVVLGDSNYQTFGGHLKSGIVTVTGEIMISMIDGDVVRNLDEVCGLKLLDL